MLFTPDPDSDPYPLEWMWITREKIIVRGMLGAGAGIFVILVAIGFIYVLITAAFSFVAAITGFIALMFLTGPLKLEAEQNIATVFVALGFGFLAFNCVALVLDVVFAHQQPRRFLRADDRQGRCRPAPVPAACRAGCFGALVLAGYALPEVPKTVGGLLRLFAAGWVALAGAMLIAFPVIVLLMLWLRDLIRT